METARSGARSLPLRLGSKWTRCNNVKIVASSLNDEGFSLRKLDAFWPIHSLHSCRSTVFSVEPLAESESGAGIKLKNCTNKHYKELLRNYVDKRCEIQCWSDFFFQEMGRRPKLRDVDVADIPWLQEKFRDYLAARTSVLLEAEGHPARVGMLREIQAKFADNTTISDPTPFHEEVQPPYLDEIWEPGTDVKMTPLKTDLRVRRREMASRKKGKTAVGSAENVQVDPRGHRNSSFYCKEKFDKFLDGLTKPGQTANKFYESISLPLSKKRSPRKSKPQS